MLIKGRVCKVAVSIYVLWTAGDGERCVCGCARDAGWTRTRLIITRKRSRVHIALAPVPAHSINITARSLKPVFTFNIILPASRLPTDIIRTGTWYFVIYSILRYKVLIVANGLANVYANVQSTNLHAV